MPGPDPHGIDLAPGWPEKVSVFVYHFPKWAGHSGGNRKHRNDRARRVLERLGFQGWLCAWCADPVPLFRRADAIYCCVSCRKKAARSRRLEGGSNEASQI